MRAVVCCLASMCYRGICQCESGDIWVPPPKRQSKAPHKTDDFGDGGRSEFSFGEIQKNFFPSNFFAPPPLPFITHTHEADRRANKSRVSAHRYVSSIPRGLPFRHLRPLQQEKKPDPLILSCRPFSPQKKKQTKSKKWASKA